MDPAEIRAIRGSLSRAAFARLLGVTPLTVIRWELPEGSKEARRPRPKMIEALRKLAAEGVGAAARASGPEDEDEPDADASEPAPEAGPDRAPPSARENSDDEAVVYPQLDRLGTESWPAAENQLLGLLSSGALKTSEGRVLASLGLVQAQLFGRFDLRSALTTLLPILDDAERGRLPRPIAARAHVFGAVLFGAPDARFYDPGRVNAHAARAEALLDPKDPGSDDLRVYLATGSISGARFLGPHVLMRTYQAHAPALARASRPLATILAQAMHHVGALLREDNAAAARHSQGYLALVGQLKMPYIYVAIFVGLAHRAVNSSVTPHEILAIAEYGRGQAQAARVGTTEGLLHLYACEVEAYIRLGRFADAENTYRSALELARRDGMPTYPLVVAACRLFVLLNRHADLEAMADELEAEGPPRAGPHHHAFFARAVALNMKGEGDSAIELIERVCSAPNTAPGIDHLRHGAFVALLWMYLLQRNYEKTKATIHRFSALLEERPSVWHAVVLRRIEAFTFFFEGRVAEARQKLESIVPAFRLLGDVTERAIAELNLAVVARASGAPGSEARVAEALKGIQALGIPLSPTMQRIQNARVHTPAWAEQTMCERLVIAMDRLSVRGLRADQLRGEITSIASDLFPDRTVTVTPVSADTAAREGVEVADGDGGLLGVSVDGPLSPEQFAALRLLKALVPSDGAGSRATRAAEMPIDADLPAFIAVAPATRQLKREIAQLSKSNATILVHGESGSGKEVVARGVHDLSSRVDKPYVAFNCASVPRDLFEGQLFGYKKGAFTGATSDNPGVIRAADGGTLFLDEIGELPLDTQPKLLRFLENGEVFPFGEQKPRRVDVRMLAATHRDLGRLVREGHFREDLYYRLNVVPLFVPPLRERREDVVPLARMFVARLAPDGEEKPQLGADAVTALEAHTWPGNVRELRNVIERAMAYAPVPSVLRAEHLRIGRT